MKVCQLLLLTLTCILSTGTMGSPDPDQSGGSLAKCQSGILNAALLHTNPVSFKMKFIYSLYNIFLNCKFGDTDMSFKKQLGCIFKAKDILINVLSDSNDQNSKSEKKDGKGSGSGGLAGKIEKAVEIGGFVSDGNIDGLLRSFDYIDTLENLSHCKVMMKMSVDQNCLMVYEEFIRVIRESFGNLKAFTSIED